jgi:hypothetical protein
MDEAPPPVMWGANGCDNGGLLDNPVLLAPLTHGADRSTDRAITVLALWGDLSPVCPCLGITASDSNSA